MRCAGVRGRGPGGVAARGHGRLIGRRRGRCGRRSERSGRRGGRRRDRRHHRDRADAVGYDRSARERIDRSNRAGVSGRTLEGVRVCDGGGGVGRRDAVGRRGGSDPVPRGADVRCAQRRQGAEAVHRRNTQLRKTDRRERERRERRCLPGHPRRTKRGDERSGVQERKHSNANAGPPVANPPKPHRSQTKRLLRGE